MNCILVTGGAEFIGSNFIHFMLDQQPTTRITNLDTLTYAGKPDNLSSIASRDAFRFIYTNI